ASSHALKVGAHTPMSGENASPTPAAVPFRPLSSAYVCTALMNETPTSGPIRTSITHQARDANSSRHSLRSSHMKAPPVRALIFDRLMFLAGEAGLIPEGGCVTCEKGVRPLFGSMRSSKRGRTPFSACAQPRAFRD